MTLILTHPIIHFELALGKIKNVVQVGVSILSCKKLFVSTVHSSYFGNLVACFVAKLPNLLDILLNLVHVFFL